MFFDGEQVSSIEPEDEALARNDGGDRADYAAHADDEDLPEDATGSTDADGSEDDEAWED